MFVETIRRAVMASSRVELPKVAAQVWRAFAAELLSEDQAQELAELIEVRKVIPIERPAARRVGSRPITSESLARRRRWVASGMLPPTLACRFTPAETAVLAVIAAEASKRGECRLPIGAIAALAGVSKTSVRNAMREARAAGLLEVKERRLSRWRNDTNVVRIVSREWTTWLTIGVQRGGRKSVQRTNNQIQDRANMQLERHRSSRKRNTLEGSRIMPLNAKARPERSVATLDALCLDEARHEATPRALTKVR